MSGTEIAIKSEHLKNIRAEIDRLESDKFRIEDWVKSKEKEMDSLNTQATKIREGLAVEKKEAGKQAEKNKADLALIENLRNNLRETEKKIEAKNVNLTNLEGRLVEYEKSLKDFDSKLGQRKLELDKKESWINSVFEAFEEIK
jgi:chromosome segregation ATPase